MSQAIETLDLPTQITIDLTPPITFDNREYTQLVLREPTAGDILLGEEQIKNGMNAWTLRNRQIHLIAKCSGVPVPVVTRLPMRVFNRAWAYISPFYEFGLETGVS
jgi:Phage tail assembly chaperone proteins, E, or 41 or 14